jgi:hypothetical protein|tara:strand:- start:92 stop:238 length:147 start_codon:yes stop_codon:yes gene_type:complete
MFGTTFDNGFWYLISAAIKIPHLFLLSEQSPGSPGTADQAQLLEDARL